MHEKRIESNDTVLTDAPMSSFVWVARAAGTSLQYSSICEVVDELGRDKAEIDGNCLLIGNMSMAASQRRETASLTGASPSSCK